MTRTEMEMVKAYPKLLNQRGERTDANDEWGDEEYYTELKVDYLHQLQNLFFSLCGTELEIKN